MADAIDLAVEQLMVYENRERLANDTAAYFENMTDEEAAEEQKLEAALSQSAAGIDFDEVIRCRVEARYGRRTSVTRRSAIGY